MDLYQVAARGVGDVFDMLFADTLDRLSEALNLNPWWFQYIWTAMFVYGVFLFLNTGKEDVPTKSMEVEFGRFSILKNTGMFLCLGPFALFWGFIFLPPWLVFKLSVEIYDELSGSK